MFMLRMKNCDCFFPSQRFTAQLKPDGCPVSSGKHSKNFHPTIYQLRENDPTRWADAPAVLKRPVRRPKSRNWPNLPSKILMTVGGQDAA